MNDTFGGGTKKRETWQQEQARKRAEGEEKARLAQEARINLFSANQSAYQETRQAVEDALVPPKPLEANKARTISAPLNSGPVNTSNIRNSSPLAPPANVQGNAKPLFKEEFEQKASMLAGSLDQAGRVGY